MRPRLIALLALLVAAELAALFPGVFFRGEVLSDAALAYSMAPWKGHVPLADPPLQGNPTLSDDMSLFTPWDAAVRQAAAAHRVPLWSPGSGCGMPLLANDQSAVLAPCQLVRLVWNSPRAHTWGLLLKPILAAIGMALLLVRWQLSPGAAFIGGLAWANSAAMTVWLLYPLAEVLAWFPWLLLGVSQLLGIGGPISLRGGFVVAAGGAAMLLAGHLPTAVQLLAATAGGVVLVLALRRDARRRVAALAGFTLLALCLAAPQLLPTASYLAGSHARLARGGASPSAASHLPIRAAWSWLVPRGFGSPERAGYHGAMNFNEAVAGVGLPSLFLALLAVGLAPRRRELAMGGAVLVSAAAAYGLPPLPWLLSHLPLLRWVAAQRWLLLTQWAMAGLAACGVDSLLEKPRRRILSTSALVGAGLLALVSLHPGLRGSDNAPASVLAAREVLLAAAGVVIAAAAIGVTAFGRRRFVCPTLAVLTVVWGGLLAWGFNPSIPPAAIPGVTAEAKELDRVRQGGRILPVGWVLRPNTGLLAGLPTASGVDDFLPERYFQFASAARFDALDAGQPFDPGSIALLRRAATTLVVADRPLAGVGLEPVACDGRTLWAARLGGAQPLAAWYPRAIPVSDAAQAFAILAQTRLIDEDTVLVESASMPLPRGPGLTTPLEIRRDTDAQLTLRCAQPRDGVLVVREAIDPGWHATVDGRAAPLLATDGMFLGVLLPRGEHTVELAYRPAAWRLGLVLAALALVALLVVAVATQRFCGASPVSKRET